MKLQEERKRKEERIVETLEISKSGKKVFANGKKHQKRKILLGMGSNWEVNNKKVVFKPYKETYGLKNINQFQLGENQYVRTEKTRLNKPKKLDQELVGSIWSGQRESNPCLSHGKAT